MENSPPLALFLGAGYTAKTMMRQLKSDPVFKAMKMVGTTRSGQNFAGIRQAGAEPFIYEGEGKSAKMAELIRKAEIILISISPDKDGDIILRNFKDDITANSQLKWVGYLSTVGVYGNHDGNWVDEESETRPGSKRSAWRKIAENQWLERFEGMGLPVHLFRLPGIYGPGRGPQNKLAQGRARRIEKKGQVFNRAHVEDIASVLIASLKQPNPGAIYNIADDKPAPPQDVLAYAAELMGLEIPPLIPFEEAEMSDMAKSFYSDNKRVSNKRIKEELGITLEYPTYKEGIRASLSSK